MTSKIPGIVDDVEARVKRFPAVHLQLEPRVSRSAECEAFLGSRLGPQVFQVIKGSIEGIFESGLVVWPSRSDSKIVRKPSGLGSMNFLSALPKDERGRR